MHYYVSVYLIISQPRYFSKVRM